MDDGRGADRAGVRGVTLTPDQERQLADLDELLWPTTAERQPIEPIAPLLRESALDAAVRRAERRERAGLLLLACMVVGLLVWVWVGWS